MNFSEDLDRVAYDLLGRNFKYRPGQKEAIEDILETFYEGVNNTYILDAPVGSGKSIIALITSYIINQSKLRGYILASDLSLFDQYNVDIDLYNFNNVKSIKGSDNYKCDVNLSSFKYGDCKVKNLSSSSTKMLPCYNSCSYYSARAFATSAPTALLTYSYALIQRNYVAPKLEGEGKNPPFDKRDFVICDEAHKVTKIVQSHFSPKITNQTPAKLEKIYQTLKQYGLNLPSLNKYDINSILKEIYSNENKSVLFYRIKDLENLFLDYTYKSNQLKELVGSQMRDKNRLDEDLKQVLNLCEYVKDMHCKLEDYSSIIGTSGIDAMVKNNQGDNSIIFNCIDESYLMHKHFHDQFGFKLFMSGTIGDPSDFIKDLGIKSASYTRIPNTFDFSRSPIVILTGDKLTYKTKEKSFPSIIRKASTLLEHHKDEKGIIHTGSYENSKILFNSLSRENQKRVLIYGDSAEKTKLLEEYINSTNKVLIGPSLLEGLNLDGDKSRFQIFLKVPFPSLSDKFVKAKMDYLDGWYDKETVSGILQGVGRSVRSEHDYATTYFLDDCIRDVISRKRGSFPEDFKQRLKITTIEDFLNT